MSPTGRVSATTAASNVFVAEHHAAAADLGTRVADLAGDPDALIAALRTGFSAMADPAAADGIRSVTPGIGPVMGVRLPLLDAAHRSFRRGTRNTPTNLLLDCVDRLLTEEYRELRWFGMWNMERLLATDPERTWQLMGRAAAEADEWITVDTLAHPYAAGILRDPGRWSDLEALVRSPSRWQRRLVGSTLATMPHARHAGSKDKAIVSRGLALIGRLSGDPEPDVQKALSWALRSLAPVDPAAVIAFVEKEAATASRTGDGNRAWVVRDALPKLPDATADTLRVLLTGIRRRPGRNPRED